MRVPAAALRRITPADNSAGVGGRSPLVYPEIVSILSIREAEFADRRDWRGARWALLCLSLEEASPRGSSRPVRTEPGRRDLGLWRRVLRPGPGVPARRRPRDGRCDRAVYGALGEHHAEPWRRQRRHRWRRLLLDRPARAPAVPATARARCRRHGALRHPDPNDRPAERPRSDRRLRRLEFAGTPR